MQALFKHGNPLAVDYTPGSAVSAGDVVVVGDVPFVSRLDVAANDLGALDAGGGVYELTADAAIAAGKTVYWDDTNNKATATALSNTHFGHVAPSSSAAADGDKLLVIHAPNGA